MKTLNKFIYSILFICCLFGITSAQQKEKEKFTPIKITEFPKPAYTEEAQKNNISGKVTLNVEFLSNGEIGDVQEIADKNDDKLRRFGLVNQAIKAAKTIQFKPATVNGKSVTRIKSVIFTFRLF
jgi:TonB family protein